LNKFERYFGEARERAKRRRSPWNLILIPLAILCIGLVYYFFWKLATVIQSNMIPSNAIIWNYSKLGGVLMYVPTLLPSLSLGMIFANFIAWCIPPARKAFDREANGVKNASVRSATRSLFIISIVLMLVTFPISILGLQNYYYVNEAGVYYHTVLTKRQYNWDDVKEVLIGCSTNRYHKIELKYILTFRDGTKVDLWENNFLKFLNVYDNIFAHLKTNKEIEYVRRISDWDVGKIAPRWSPRLQEGVRKVLEGRFIKNTN
jgi:hypothetical protein